MVPSKVASVATTFFLSRAGISQNMVYSASPASGKGKGTLAWLVALKAGGPPKFPRVWLQLNQVATRTQVQFRITDTQIP